MRSGALVTATIHGKLVAVASGDNVQLYTLPDLAPHAEIAVHGASHDLQFVDDGSRLLILSRGADAQLHVVDPHNVRKLADVALRGSAELGAISGSVAFVLGSAASVIDVSEPTPLPHVLPVRGTIGAVASLGERRFLVASSSAIEEWDGGARVPIRRLRFDRILDLLYIGAAGSRVWMVTKQAPAVVEVTSLANRTTRRLELAEPIHRVVARPTGDVIALIGSSRTSLVDVGHDPPTIIFDHRAEPILDLAWIGPETFVGYFASGELSIVESSRITRITAPRMDAVKPPPDLADEHEPSPALERNEVLAPIAPEIVETGWRAELIAWARGAVKKLPERSPILEVSVRLDAEELRHAIGLLYAARLLGTNGVSADDLVSVMGRWEDVLAEDGALQRLGIVRRRRDRWHLCEELSAYLDRRGPRRGVLVDSPATPNGSVAIVGVADEDLARRLAPRLGPIHVADRRGELAPTQFILEARIRGALPLVPWTYWRDYIEHPTRAVFVVETADEALETGAPLTS